VSHLDLGARGILGELRLAFVCALLVLAGERRGFGSLAAPLGKQPHALVRQAKLLGLAIVVRGGELGAFLARGACGRRVPVKTEGVKTEGVRRRGERGAPW